MSERELRKVAGHKGTCRHSQTHYMSTPEPCTCGLDEALTADPDVVAVARKIVDEVCKGTLSPEQVWAVGLIKRWMEETFKFRLTDKGWEWTADA